jgi:predicted membrane metal-binding protein
VYSQELQKSGVQFTFLTMYLTYALLPSLRNHAVKIYPACQSKQNTVFYFLLAGFVVSLVAILLFIAIVGGEKTQGF